jgi:hypothetical protein
LIGLAVLAGGIFLCWMAFEAFQAGSWPRADGKVESITLLENQSNGRFKVQISYQYTVAGTTYHGSRFNTRGDHVNALDEIKEIARTYRVGAPCSVAYNPRIPRHSFLETKATGYAYARMALGIPVAIAGLALIVSGVLPILRWWKANRHESTGE